ncbi:hypothetical protein ACWDPI_39585, partial [Streptomyces zhihengii]
LENGTYPTLQKSTLTTKGSGENYTVNDASKVTNRSCGRRPGVPRLPESTGPRRSRQARCRWSTEFRCRRRHPR